MSHAPAKKAHAPDETETAAPAAETPLDPPPKPKPAPVNILVRSDIHAALRNTERQTGMAPEQVMSLVLCVAAGVVQTSVFRIYDKPTTPAARVEEWGYDYKVPVSRQWYESHGPIAWGIGLPVGEMVNIALSAATIHWLSRIPKVRMMGHPKVDAGVRAIGLAPKARNPLGYD